MIQCFIKIERTTLREQQYLYLLIYVLFLLDIYYLLLVVLLSAFIIALCTILC